MKLRVLFLKKIHILYLILFISVCCSSLLLFNRKTNENVFATAKNKTLLKADLTGDGKEDILYINTENDKYYVQVTSNEKSFYLQPDKKMSSMGYYYPFYPMKVNLLDITRDKIPEIFIQSMERGSSIQHIFFWNGTEFKDIFCSSNNVIGIIDSKNNRTPKFSSGIITSSSANLSYFMQINGSIERIQMNDSVPGKTEVISMINYIQSLPSGEAAKPVEIFYPGISGRDLSLIGKMASEKKLYKFTDAFFMDSKFSKDGEAIEYKWVLNFKATLAGSGTNSESRSIVLKLKKTSEPNNPFKIVSITENLN